ncbi:MAG: hypothetical protein ACRD0G_08400, partial [Acidimicrobiales bacterium]
SRPIGTTAAASSQEGDVDDARMAVEEATRRWVALVGSGADPHDPDAIVRGHDPQQHYTAGVETAGPAVDVVAGLHRSARARWRVLWATIGHPEPPPDQVDAVLDTLLGSHRDAQRRLTELEAAEDRRRAVARPLVLVEPSVWGASDRVARLVRSLPEGSEVVALERRLASESVS